MYNYCNTSFRPFTSLVIHCIITTSYFTLSFPPVERTIYVYIYIYHIAIYQRLSADSSYKGHYFLPSVWMHFGPQSIKNFLYSFALPGICHIVLAASVKCQISSRSFPANSLVLMAWRSGDRGGHETCLFLSMLDVGGRVKKYLYV
jgi:hypothetical protein